MTRQADARGTRQRALSFGVAILFGLLFAYDLIEAITNLIGLPAQVAEANEFAVENGLARIEVPWGILIANTVLPIAAFGAAWWMGRGRSLAVQAMFYLVALATVAAVTLTLTALV